MDLVTLSIITISIYFITACGFGLRIAGLNLNHFIKSSPYVLYVLGFILHGFLLYKWIDTTHGQNLSLLNLLSFTTWLMVIFALFSSLRKNLDSLYVIILSLAAISIVSITLSPSKNIIDLHPVLPNTAHIILVFSAFSLLTMALIQASMLSLQSYLIKNKFGFHNSLMRILPSLETMEKLLFQIIWTGFILLTMSFVVAFYFLRSELNIDMLPKIIFSMLAWLMFAILLTGNYCLGWRGRLAVRFTYFSFACLFLAYFGLKLIFGSS